MISSRCEATIPDEAGKPVKLSEVRRALKQEWEAVRPLDKSPLFEVWINEEEPVVEASQDLWEKCLLEVRDADIVLAIYTGESGWVKAGGTIGICHAEFHEGWSKTPAKVFPINVELAAGTKVSERDAAYREYFADKQFFGSPVTNSKALRQRCNEALRAAITSMVKLGKFEARKGNFNTGDALEWSRLDFATRQEHMMAAMRSALLTRGGKTVQDEAVMLTLVEAPILFCLHAVPASMSVAAARESVGQPFLRDHLALTDDAMAGPVHLIACHRGVTETQSLNHLGFPDATVVSTRSWVYVADEVQKIQIIFLANCRDQTTTNLALQGFFEWLAQVQEAGRLSDRAQARGRIVRAIAREAFPRSQVPSPALKPARRRPSLPTRSNKRTPQ
jgi:hypothetical protein